MAYRVFVSYSHDDTETVQGIVHVLEENGLRPTWDKDLVWGYGFHEQIRRAIAHAHIFMPIITESSSRRGWVHQEIGYAWALNIPVLPICLDQEPGQMLRELQALIWDGDLDKLRRALSLRNIEGIIRARQQGTHALYECAAFDEDRTALIADWATRVWEIGGAGRVRQKGALSSFHIPTSPVGSQAWQARYGSMHVSEYRCRLLREERLSLQRHAAQAGCSLIIDPTLDYSAYGPAARRVRLRSLLDFLQSDIVADVVIAVHERLDVAQNVIVLGDWWTAESVSAAQGKGYMQTIFTRHAPTVDARQTLFDAELNECLAAMGVSAEHSRAAVIELLQGIIAGIKE